MLYLAININGVLRMGLFCFITNTFNFHPLMRYKISLQEKFNQNKELENLIRTENWKIIDFKQTLSYCRNNCYSSIH